MARVMFRPGRRRLKSQRVRGCLFDAFGQSFVVHKRSLWAKTPFDASLKESLVVVGSEIQHVLGARGDVHDNRSLCSQ
jgi:hypothetical protein